jgi:hypothetical protein
MKISAIEIAQNQVEIHIVTKQDVTELNEITRFWNSFYSNETDLPNKNRITEYFETYTIHDAFVVCGFLDGKCIGTLQANHEQNGHFEFDYTTENIKEPVVEVSKLIIDKSYRNTTLKLVLMAECQAYAMKIYHPYVICINCTQRLLPFYEHIGFKRVDEKIHVHPILKNECYLLYCSSSDFEGICGDFKSLIAGNRQLKHIQSLRFLLTTK